MSVRKYLTDEERAIAARLRDELSHGGASLEVRPRQKRHGQLEPVQGWIARETSRARVFARAMKCDFMIEGRTGFIFFDPIEGDSILDGKPLPD